MIVQRTQKGHKPQKGVKMLKTIHIQAQSGVASYYVNTEHITYFCTQVKDIAVHFVGGDCLILEGYGDLPSIVAFSEFMKSDSKFFDFTKLPHT